MRIETENVGLDKAAMVDNGATAKFFDFRFVARHRLPAHRLLRPIALQNIDGSSNSAGDITHFSRVAFTVDSITKQLDFLITDLGGEDIILGLPWLREENPLIDWKDGILHIPRPDHLRTTIEEIPEVDPRPNLPTTDGSLLEEVTPVSTPVTTPVLERPPLDTPTPVAPEPRPDPLCFINGNRQLRRQWLRAGTIDHPTDQVWCAAGFTYSQQIAEKAEKAKPQRSLDEMIPPEYRRHATVFSESESERLPEHQPWDHAIELVPGAPETMRTKIYPMSLNKQEELNRFLKDNLRKGYIRPSKSPLASPVFFVKKKDGKLRFVQDYRKLNEITVKNRYPLPLVADIISRLRGAKYFTKFDVRWGYNNIRIKEGDEWKAAFATNQGLFEPRVMFFGLTNSPATFQALMNSIFADLTAKGLVAVYLDDILIFTATLKEHRAVTHEVLERLRKHDLYLRPEKCEFEKQQVEYLGLIIRHGEVTMDPSKVDAVRTWPTPTTLRDLRGFLAQGHQICNSVRKVVEIW